MKQRVKILGIFILIPILLFAQEWDNNICVAPHKVLAGTSPSYTRNIAAGPNGTLHCVWVEWPQDLGNLYYARSNDFGETWSTEEVLYVNPYLRACFPSIAVWETCVQVTWIETDYAGTGPVCYAISLDAGDRWQTSVLSANPRCFRPIIAVDNTGATNVVWREANTMIKGCYRLSPGDDWSSIQSIYDEHENYFLNSVSISAEGLSQRVHIAAARVMNGNPQVGDIVYIRSLNQGCNWERARYIHSSGSEFVFNSLSISALNNIVQIVWNANQHYIMSFGSYDGGDHWDENIHILDSSNEVMLLDPSVVIDQANIVHVVWSKNVSEPSNYEIFYTRSLNGGVSWQSITRISYVDYYSADASVVCISGIAEWTTDNGIYVFWSNDDDKAGIYRSIYFKRGWQIGESASYPNQGRHLGRTVNTTNCYPVFQGEKAVFWQSRNSQTVNPPVGISDGKYPTVAVSPEGLSWTCYTTEAETEQHLKCQIRNEFSMEDITIFDAESIFAPSLILATKIGDMGYVVYTIKDQGQYVIRFAAFDQDGVYYQTCLDHGNSDHLVCKPTISITPADFVHIVWQKFDNNTNRIFYITTLAPFSPDMIRNGYEPQWSSFDRVSTPEWPTTEPASNPFVEACGDQVYVVWKGPYDEGNPTGEIWQRRGRIRPGEVPNWYTPWNVSESELNESDYPVKSTNAFVAWQELEDQNNWEIKLRYNTDDVQNISNTETPSQYPHINVMYTENEVPRIYFIWTETNAPDIYELRFRDYQYTPEKDDLDEIVYYIVNAGDSTQSYYCEHRDGYIRYPNFPIDFGQSQLRYRLDYLNPAYYYKTKAIVYQNTTGRFRQTLTFDNMPVDSIEFPAGRPETVEVYIPKSTYSQDLQSVLRANRTQGNFSALTTFGLTQFEIIDSTGAGTGPQSANNTTVTLTPIDNFPNPFRTHTSVRYSLPVASRVSLAIYNASGILVKTLIDQHQASGSYSVNWDGTDNQKKLVPAGVYFYRLDTDYSSQTKKVSIIR